MEELQPEELEELLRELEEESQEEETLSPEVEALLQDLQPTRLYTSRRRAAEQLGKVSRSSRQIARALVETAATDSSAEVRATAAESLRAPVHQAVLRRHRGLVEQAQSEAQRRVAAQPATRPAHFQAEHKGGTLHISWKPEPGQRKEAIQGPLFLLLLSAILLLAFASWPPGQLRSVLVFVFCVVTLGSGYWILAVLANSTRINAGKEEWVIQRGPLAFPLRDLYLRPRRLDPADCNWVWTDRVAEYKRVRASGQGGSAVDPLGCLPVVGSLALFLRNMRRELVVTYKLYVRMTDGTDKELLRLLSKEEAEYLRYRLQALLDAGAVQPDWE